MTEHLYYENSFLYEFDAEVVTILPSDASRAQPAVVLDKTAFYPTSGGQVFDTGWLAPTDSPEQRSKVMEVVEGQNDLILHLVEKTGTLEPGMRVHGSIDIERRRDHMQQHSGQHVLSAVFVRLFDMATLSFHMGDDYCSIDLEAKSLTAEQVAEAERVANEAVLEDIPVQIRFVSQEEARSLGLRKLPPADRGLLRLIGMGSLDLSACGGTHVRSTGQIGCILLRKTEKVKQGIRVEFVCGQRAVSTARRDYSSLTEAAGLFSAQLWDVPQQVRKMQDDAKVARRQREQILDELAEQHAFHLLSEAASEGGRKLIDRVFPERDLSYIKLLAQKLTRAEANVVALLGTTAGQASVVVAASPGQPFDLGALLKEALHKFGGRGGGSKDMAQGGVADPKSIEPLLSEMAGRIKSSRVDIPN